LLGAAAASALPRESESAAPIPIIDTHIHLFDPGRPQGVPWPPKDNPVLYQAAFPDRYRRIAVPLGIKGAIEVEASPWLEDNQWVLDVIAKDPLLVGTVGDLEPGKPDFGKQLERFHRNPMFLGIRYGNLWGRDLSAEIARPQFVADIKLLSSAGLVLDTANPDPKLLAAILRLSDAVPNLRIVIDHLPQLNPPEDAPARNAYLADLGQFAKRPQVYVKISEVLRRVDGKVPADPAFYRPRIDEIFGVFGEDRVLFGSDWPNSDIWAPYPEVLQVVQDYFTRKGPAVAEKYFWRNSLAAYRWKPRDPAQRRLRA
jgi:predicted TIM-barrel fold metal-dependent hydrolase